MNLILLPVYLLKILKTLFLVNFMTLLSLLVNFFFSFSVSQYFTFSILYNVLCTYLSLHARCHCNDSMLPAWRINFFIMAVAQLQEIPNRQNRKKQTNEKQMLNVVASDGVDCSARESSLQ